ncbi:MAG: hypothetical protein J6Y20_05265 [Lachnospiraceae bacterium]|nr:hypothetical protein [Lachnospiraceae bacterium]
MKCRINKIVTESSSPVTVRFLTVAKLLDVSTDYLLDDGATLDITDKKFEIGDKKFRVMGIVKE